MRWLGCQLLAQIPPHSSTLRKAAVQTQQLAVPETRGSVEGASREHLYICLSLTFSNATAKYHVNMISLLITHGFRRQDAGHSTGLDPHW